MSLLFKIKQKLPKIEVEQLHRLFAATIIYHASDMGVKEANASFKACYDFDAEFSAATYRLWSCSRYTMVNLKYFVMWLAKHPRTTLKKSIDVAAQYGVKKMDALMIRNHLVLTRISIVDESLISVSAMHDALALFNRLVPDLIKALQQQVGKNCQWLRRSTNMTVDDMVSDILGDVIPAYYSLVPTTRSEDHIRNHMYAAVSGRVKNYLNMHSSIKRKRSQAIKHRDGSVDYEYLECNEAHLNSSGDTGSVIQDVMAVDENSDRLAELTDREISIRSLIKRAPARCKTLYRLVFGKSAPRFEQYLESNKLSKPDMSTTDWILSVPFHKFVKAYSDFANVPEEGIHSSLAKLKCEVF
jgi:hypothetical protein